MSQDRYDVIIIGTGAGGGTLARRLAPSGKKILLLERGDFLRREKDNWDSKVVVLDHKYVNAETWSANGGERFQPGQHYYVGGNTKFYGAALVRFRERDFQEIRHHGGVSPAWPIGYQDLRPYYLEAERLYHVHGTRGEDPTEPYEAAPYPYPAVSHEPRIQQLHDDWSRIGKKPFHLPIGVMLNEADPHASTCIRCNTCDGYPCMVHAKADAEVIGVRPALEHSNVTLLTGTLVERLETDATGRSVSKVVVRRNGRTDEFGADLVVASCGAINSAALLMRSASDKHPNGLANSSDMVGRHYMCHNNSVLLAFSHTPNPTVFQKTIALNDFYFDDGNGFDFPLGHISMVGKADANTLAAGAPPFAPGVVLDEMAKHSIDFWLTSEDLPDPNNRITLDRDGGIHISYTENNLEGHKRLVERLKSMMKEIGCENKLLPCYVYAGKKIPIAKVAHQCGTMRFGRDPKTSVLDVNCKAHDLDNLYVVDGSFFVSSTAVNPGLTIIANALRVGDHLLERLS
jgi:choline dehydrogenase-like flavoprotein